MSYKNGQNIRRTAMWTRRGRVRQRFIKKFGLLGSANLGRLTGKQAARYGRAFAQDNLARYGQTFRPQRAA